MNETIKDLIEQAEKAAKTAHESNFNFQQCCESAERRCDSSTREGKAILDALNAILATQRVQLAVSEKLLAAQESKDRPKTQGVGEDIQGRV